MNRSGVFDLAAPLFDAIDNTLGLALPTWMRVLLYALFAAWLSMWLYARLSPQRRLHAVRRSLRATQRRMLDDDIEFDEVLRRSRRSLGLASAQVWMTLWPTLLIAIPLLFLLSWMSNRFDAQLPASGVAVALCVVPPSMAASLQSSQTDSKPVIDDGGCRQLQWPDAASPIMFSDGRQKLLQLPLAHPVGILHKRQWWNFFLGNPLGYIPVDSGIDEIHIALPGIELVPFGPSWMRGWLPSFLVVMTVVSLWLRWRWKLV
jgi:hypothetical protein